MVGISTVIDTRLSYLARILFLTLITFSLVVSIGRVNPSLGGALDGLDRTGACFEVALEVDAHCIDFCLGPPTLSLAENASGRDFLVGWRWSALLLPTILLSVAFLMLLRLKGGLGGASVVVGVTAS